MATPPNPIIPTMMMKPNACPVRVRAKAKGLSATEEYDPGPAEGTERQRHSLIALLGFPNPNGGNPAFRLDGQRAGTARLDQPSKASNLGETVDGFGRTDAHGKKPLIISFFGRHCTGPGTQDDQGGRERRKLTRT
ncbi:hypothetical protein [Salicola sp. Rm-C-2C1-2]|uniref:hypothetical protein n=1 Tax=Salicola sp. Rm-C-2C1-2 TaxID=3141321 RepID=UPI0032E3BD9E